MRRRCFWLPGRERPAGERAQAGKGRPLQQTSTGREERHGLPPLPGKKRSRAGLWAIWVVPRAFPSHWGGRSPICLEACCEGNFAYPAAVAAGDDRAGYPRPGGNDAGPGGDLRLSPHLHQGGCGKLAGPPAAALPAGRLWPVGGGAALHRRGGGPGGPYLAGLRGPAGAGGGLPAEKALLAPRLRQRGRQGLPGLRLPDAGG